MPDRINGGVITDNVLTGLLKHFKMTGADFSGAISPTNQPVHGSAAEIVFNLISLKSTIAIMNPISKQDNGMSFGLETNRADWTASKLQGAVRALGIIGVDNVDVRNIAVEQVPYDFTAVSAGGASTYLQLTDTPGSYFGEANMIVGVRADETGLEFVSPAAGGGIPDAPVDGTVYGRENASWLNVTEEAPQDGSSYVREDGNWVLLSVSGVTSIFGRTGDVVAESGDYDATKITTDTSSFTGLLSSADTDAQLAFETIDQLNISANYVEVTIDQSVSANQNYFLNASVTVTMPDYTGLTEGDTIGFAQQAEARSTIVMFATQFVMLETGNLIDTVNYNKAVGLLFIYDGTQWTLNT